MYVVPVQNNWTFWLLLLFTVISLEVKHWWADEEVWYHVSGLSFCTKLLSCSYGPAFCILIYIYVGKELGILENAKTFFFLVRGEYAPLYCREECFIQGKAHLFFVLFCSDRRGEHFFVCKKTYKIPYPFSSIYIDWSLITSTLQSYTNKAATAV